VAFLCLSRPAIFNRWLKELVITSRHGPQTKHSVSNSNSIVSHVFVVAGTCLPSRCPETVFTEPPLSNGSIRPSLTHGAEPFLRSCQLCSYTRTSQHFMEPEGSLPCSQESSTGPYREPDQSNIRHNNYLYSSFGLSNSCSRYSFIKACEPTDRRSNIMVIMTIYTTCSKIKTNALHFALYFCVSYSLRINIDYLPNSVNRLVFVTETQCFL
jgi:hypothetical protein